MTRPLLTSLLLVALFASVAGATARAQGTGDGQGGGGRPPTELWQEFPLKQPAPGSAKGSDRRSAPDAGQGQRSAADDGSTTVLPLLLGGLAALALAAAVWLGVVRRRRRSRATTAGRGTAALPAQPPEPAVANGSPAGGSAAAGSREAGSPAAGSPAARSPAAGSREAGSPAAASPAAGSPAAASPEAGRARPRPAKAPAAPGVSAAATPAAAPEAPPAPTPGAPPASQPASRPATPPPPGPEPEAPDRTVKPDGRPVAAPAPAAAAPEDGRGSREAAAPGAQSSVAGQRAVGYASVSAADDLNNAELKIQVRLIQEACQQRGLTLVKIIRDVESQAGSDLRRPGLSYALDRLAAKDASCLVVASLERLTRTAANLGALLGWLTESDARLIVIDLDLDTGTEEGQLSARALATVGGLERRKLEERTRKGLEAARSMRRSGRPAVSDRPSLKQRIADMRAQGMTLQAIADTLNAEGVPTLRGGAEWRPSSVQAAAGYKRPPRKSVLQPPAPPRKKSA